MSLTAALILGKPTYNQTVLVESILSIWGIKLSVLWSAYILIPVGDTFKSKIAVPLLTYQNGVIIKKNQSCETSVMILHYC